MLKDIFQNKGVEQPKESSSLSRETLERTKGLILSSLLTETDRAKLMHGAEQIADLNAKLRRLDDVAAAMDEISEHQRAQAVVNRTEGAKMRQAFWTNCGMIARSVFEKAPTFCLEDAESRKTFWARRVDDYTQELAKCLSFENAALQADEMLNAQIQRREWQDLISLPKPPRAKTPHREYMLPGEL